MTVKLKVFLQQQEYIGGCCCAMVCQATNGEPLFPHLQEHVSGAKKLLSEIDKLYGDKVKISVVNPSGLTALWDSFRLKIKPDTPAWVLGGKKIFEGIPPLSEIKAALDRCVELAQ
ncbi:hypothetical protein AGMMS50276_16460 [Synergistales bacterium]|nr:hypothetical protein AGMMS50276_16460 [Synergistales bacterium]